jgi:hypothetical protein
MPITDVSPEEFEKLTGSRGSVYFGARPARAKKPREVFLCPKCYELLSSPAPGVLSCLSCDKTWGQVPVR